MENFENTLKSMIKEEVDRILLKEYSCIAPYKENLVRIVNELQEYFKQIKEDIIARKNIGDNSVSLHDITLLSLENDIAKLVNDVKKIN